MTFLPSMHEPDVHAEHLFGGHPGTVVFAVAIGTNPNDRSGGDWSWWQDRGYRVMVRLNNGWHPDGTIPSPALYNSFAQRCGNYVAASRGCNIWIIGNEPNHEIERPHGQRITAENYATCFARCRSTIKIIRPNDAVVPAAVAPWNVQTGDWLEYWRTMLRAIESTGGCDGINLHAYTHGTDPALVDSDEKRNGWFWHFRTFEDQLAAVPASMQHLPADITETDQDDAWADVNSGWVKRAMLRVDAWNRGGGVQGVHSVAVYRWPNHDAKYTIATRPGVQADFSDACSLALPAPTHPPTHPTPNPPINPPDSGTPPPTHPPTHPPDRNISDDFRRRVPTIETVDPDPGERYWRITEAGYHPDGASRFGPDHHILVEVLDADGKRQFGVPVHYEWAGGGSVVDSNKVGGDYAADMGMFAAGHSYGVWVGDARPSSDYVHGMGMGKIGSEHMGDHVTYRVVFQRTMEPIAGSVIPPTTPAQPVTVPPLLHPVANPKYRTVTQPFGVNPEDYEHFTIDGIPLRGHNGVDFAVPVGQDIAAAAPGWVAESRNDPGGYGEYIKLIHPWGETLYAHLSRRMADVGESVNKGAVIGKSGNTGNSTGAHLHFALRRNPYNRADGMGGYSDPLPFIQTNGTGQPMPPIDTTPPPKPTTPSEPAREQYMAWFKKYGDQYNVPWQLLAAVADAESGFDPAAVSDAGALGMMQFMPETWADMHDQIGVTNPHDPEQSIHAAAYYLNQIRAYLTLIEKPTSEWMLAGYNWGMGNAAGARWADVPPETKAYVTGVLESTDLLRRWETG